MKKKVMITLAALAAAGAAVTGCICLANTKVYLYPSLGEMIPGSSRIDRNKEEKWEHTSPSQNNSGNRPD